MEICTQQENSLLKNRFSIKETGRSETGINGVHFFKNYKGLVVRNYFNKKDAWTSYHFDKLGEQEAYRRTINFRQQIEEKIKQELDKLLQLCRMRQEIFKSNSKKD